MKWIERIFETDMASGRRRSRRSRKTGPEEGEALAIMLAEIPDELMGIQLSRPGIYRDGADNNL